MREREIEAYFVKRVKEAGGLSRKFVSPGHRGVPDQIVVYAGNVYFVELKAPGKGPSLHQLREHARLYAAGAVVNTLCSKEGVDMFIEQVMR
jgi:hypothetical protein